jgi:hypothetical protein
VRHASRDISGRAVAGRNPCVDGDHVAFVGDGQGVLSKVGSPDPHVVYPARAPQCVIPPQQTFSVRYSNGISPVTSTRQDVSLIRTSTTVLKLAFTSNFPSQTVALTIS